MSQVTLQELVVELKADITDHRNKLKTAGEITKKEIGGIQKSFDGLLSPLSASSQQIDAFKASLAAAGVIAGAVFVKNCLESADALDDLSESLGVSSTFLQEMGYAAKVSGLETETMNQALGVFSRNIGQAAAGSQEMAKGFRTLGVSITDSSGKLKTTEQLFYEVADGVGRFGSEAEQAAALSEVFGRAGGKFVALFKEGSPAIREMANKAHELGLVLDESLIRNAGKANDQIEILGKVLKTQATAAVAQFAPEIQRGATFLIEFTKNTIDSAKALAEWARYLRFMGTGTGDTKTKIDALNIEIGNLKNKIADMQEPGLNFTKVMSAVGASMSVDSMKEMVTQFEAHRNALEKQTSAASRAGDAHKKFGASLAEANRIEAERQKLQESAQKIVDGAGGKEAQLEKDIETLQKAEALKLKLKGDANQALAEKELELKAFKEEEAVKEIEALMERNDLLKAIDEERYAGEIERNRNAISSKLTALQGESDAALKIKAKQQQAEDKYNEVRKANFASTLNYIATLQNAKSKELAAVGKAAAIAMATIDGVVAVQKALASAPPPFNYVLAALVGTAAAANVAKIAGVELATGLDTVPGIGHKDNFPARLMPGEGVLDRGTNKGMKALARDYMEGELGGGLGGNITVELMLRDDLVDFIEARIIERGRLNTGRSLLVA